MFSTPSTHIIHSFNHFIYFTFHMCLIYVNNIIWFSFYSITSLPLQYVALFFVDLISQSSFDSFSFIVNSTINKIISICLFQFVVNTWDHSFILFLIKCKETQILISFNIYFLFLMWKRKFFSIILSVAHMNAYTLKIISVLSMHFIEIWKKGICFKWCYKLWVQHQQICICIN